MDLFYLVGDQGLGVELKEVPAVSIEIREYGYGAVRFVPRLLLEDNALCLHAMVVTPKIIGVQEEKDAASGLIPDVSSLLGCSGLGEKDACFVGSWRCDQKPTLAVGERSVFYEFESERFGVEGECFIVVANEECDVTDVWHGYCLS